MKSHLFLLIIFFIVSIIGIWLNLDAPELVNNMDNSTIILEFICLLQIAWYIIKNTLKSYPKIVVETYYLYFLGALCLELIILHFIWAPSLDPSYKGWGFDPQRYYYYCSQLIKYGESDYGLNYQGVIYFYRYTMELFGLNPLIPLFINVLLALYATTLLSRTIANRQTICKYAFLLVIPEVISFNLMSSREILNMAAMTIALVKFIEFRQKRTNKNITIMILSFLLLVIVRPPMAAPLVFGIMVQSMFKGSKRYRAISITILIIMIGAFAYGLAVSESMGSNFGMEYMENAVSSGVSGETEAREDAKEGGMTVWLIPHNPIEYVVFGIIRCFAYVIPPPLIITNFANEFSLKTLSIYPNLTVLAMFFLLPSIYRGLKKIKSLPPDIQLIAVVALMYFLVIGVTLTNLIHQRYRLIYDLLFFGFAIWCRTNNTLLRQHDNINKRI